LDPLEYDTESEKLRSVSLDIEQNHHCDNYHKRKVDPFPPIEAANKPFEVLGSKPEPRVRKTIKKMHRVKWGDCHITDEKTQPEQYKSHKQPQKTLADCPQYNMHPNAD
jgi:hypothetical protein